MGLQQTLSSNDVPTDAPWNLQSECHRCSWTAKMQIDLSCPDRNMFVTASHFLAPACSEVYRQFWTVEQCSSY